MAHTLEQKISKAFDSFVKSVYKELKISLPFWKVGGHTAQGLRLSREGFKSFRVRIFSRGSTVFDLQRWEVSFGDWMSWISITDRSTVQSVVSDIQKVLEDEVFLKRIRK